ncbi:glycosyltransferase family 87 protein [Prosthecomicrobium sp. N25]|uniref:glycosyltransferase family 87 protein n=1 Tax=Prosthecomicrobium sp. N25 TaxID=3129254 RepID=UPI003077EAAD
MDGIRNLWRVFAADWLAWLAAGTLALFAIVYVPSVAKVNAPTSSDVVGHDYMSFYAAGRLVLAGTPEKAYDRAAHVAMQREAAREAKGGDGFADAYYFAYPPTYLTVVTPFAALPYMPAFYTWMLVTGALYVFAVWRILPGWRTVLLAIAAPGALCTFIFGQNAFLTAGLMGLALWSLDRRPLVAGFLIGLLCFKPQLGLVFPVILVATGRWRAVAGAALGVAASVAVSLALHGPETWQAVLAASGGNKDTLLENSKVGFGKIVTVFSALRWFGVPVLQAYAMQALAALTAAILVVRLWRSGAALEVKAAGALAATFLMTPFALPYDLMAEMPAVAFLVAHARRVGFARGETWVLGLVVLSPAVATLAFEGPAFLAGVAGAALLFGWTLHRAGVTPWAGARATGLARPA